MALMVMLNPKKPGSNAYYEPISGLHVTLTKRQGQVNEMNPYIFNALKNGTLVPLNFRVSVETMEVEMIGGRTQAAAGAGRVPAAARPSVPASEVPTEKPMQISRPGPANQTVIEKPKEQPAMPPVIDNQPENQTVADSEEKALRRAKGRPKAK